MAKSKYEKLVEPRLDEIKDWARNGATDEIIIEKLGIAPASFYKYQKEFSEFSESLKESKEICDGKVESALYKSACDGNTTAMIFWLKNRRPEKWREKIAEAEPGGTMAEAVIRSAEGKP